MTCTEHRLNLSLQLDGRLPPGKRVALSAHLEQCGDCATFGTELRRAQDLALGLPPLRVARDFRDQLWHRIESGEAAPDVDLLPPVPAGAKLRYLVLGAAAAAAVIAILRLGFGAPGDPLPEPRPEGSALIAGSGDAPVDATPQLAVAAMPLQPYEIARVAYESTAAGALRLKALIEQPKADPDEVQQVVQDLRPSVRMMAWLVESGHANLPPEANSQLHLLKVTLSQLPEVDAGREMRAALRFVRTVDPAQLQRPFQITCCDSTDFVRELARFGRQDPEAVGLFLHVYREGNQYRFVARPRPVRATRPRAAPAPPAPPAPPARPVQAR
jgi:hypothetical protein